MRLRSIEQAESWLGNENEWEEVIVLRMADPDGPKKRTWPRPTANNVDFHFRTSPPIFDCSALPLLDGTRAR